MAEAKATETTTPVTQHQRTRYIQRRATQACPSPTRVCFCHDYVRQLAKCPPGDVSPTTTLAHAAFKAGEAELKAVKASLSRTITKAKCIYTTGDTSLW